MDAKIAEIGGLWIFGWLMPDLLPRVNYYVCDIGLPTKIISAVLPPFKVGCNTLVQIDLWSLVFISSCCCS